MYHNCIWYQKQENLKGENSVCIWNVMRMREKVWCLFFTVAPSHTMKRKLCSSPESSWAAYTLFQCHLCSHSNSKNVVATKDQNFEIQNAQIRVFEADPEKA